MNTEQIEKARRLRERAAKIRDEFVLTRDRIACERTASARARQAVVDSLGHQDGEIPPVPAGSDPVNPRRG